MELRSSPKEFYKLIYYVFNLICFFCIASRSISMPIQGDEAGTYLRHATGGLGALFNLETANNHFLNTFLIKLTTYAAPYSEIAIRLPTLAIIAWFLFCYIPDRSCLSDWSSRLIFSSAGLFPYYVNEYASMARGYTMSGVFLSCMISEIAIYFNSPNGQCTKAPGQSRVPGEAIIFGSLSLLSSIISVPIVITALGASAVGYAKRLTPERRPDFKRLLPYISLLVGSLSLTIYTFVSIKRSGVGTINSAPAPFMDWLTGAFNMVWLPVSASAHSYGSNSPIFAITIALLTVLSGYFAIFTNILKTGFRAAIVAVLSGLFVLYLLALTGNYPIGRGLIPLWFPIIMICTILFQADGYKLRSPLCTRWLAMTIGPCLAVATLINLQINLETRYVNELKPFYYQYKSLMHYSRNQSLRCLSYGDINDEVLRFYFLNDAGPVPRPEECPRGESSQYGFMPYSLNNPEPVFK